MKNFSFLSLCVSSLFSSAQAAGEPLYIYDLSWTLKLDRKDPKAVRAIWDTCHLVAALQGLANRKAPRLYLRYLDADNFWLKVLREEDGWLKDRPAVELKEIDDLLAVFKGSYGGAVVWDEKVPATSNAASTAAGAEDLLPLRYDPEGLFGKLVTREKALEVKVWLVRPDGGSLFTAQGRIPGTEIPSRGSAKADVHTWASARYLKSGKSNPEKFAYYIDGWWLRSPLASDANQHTLTNHDYFIAQRAFFFDLSPWEDEAPVDDPGQPLGTDVRVLKEILQESYRLRRGKSMLHAGGFVPWAYKYTDHPGAGGKKAGVPTEWRYAEILSAYDAFMDADAIGIAAMANASFFQHYPYSPPERRAQAPTVGDLKKRGLLDREGRVVPAPYVAFYAGDWDSAAWLYRRIHKLWEDPSRGKVPIGWAVNPNLEDRFRPGLAWMHRHATANDFFIAGDSGAGYLNPGYLEEPRVHSDLPSGLEVWARHCERYYKRWGITLTGFIIDGNARGLSDKGLAAYARFSRYGVVPQKAPSTGLAGGMPIVRASGDIGGAPADAARHIAGQAKARRPCFLVFRSILQSPSWHWSVVQETEKLDPQVQFVDPYTLLALVRIHERRREEAASPSKLAKAVEVSFRAGDPEPLVRAVPWADGLYADAAFDGVPAIAINGSKGQRYLYFEVPDGFFRKEGPELALKVTYLDRGEGELVLEYDSRDRGAPHGGAYKPGGTARLGGSVRWLETEFHLPDARFEGSQNGGADFRLAAPPSGLAVREVRIRKVR